MTIPDGLNAEASKFYSTMLDSYTWSHAELYILETICREMTLISFIENDIDLTKLRRTGVANNDIADPLLGELRGHRSLLSNLMKTLKFPEDKKAQSTTNRANANARWAKRGVSVAA
jgi:hypothetical protein